MIVIEVLISGLALGGLYALFGLGLSLIFGVMKIANIAHGEMVIGGAFMAFTLAGQIAVPVWVLVPCVVAIMFVLGYVLQAGLVNRVLGADPIPPLLLTFGLSIIAQNLLVEFYGADNRALDVGGWQRKACGSAIFPSARCQWRRCC